jgi:glucose/arabinose dehydrogenase
MRLTASLLAAAGLALTCAAQDTPAPTKGSPDAQVQPQTRQDRPTEARKGGEPFTVRGAAFQPEKVDVTDERIQSLKKPDGFTIEKWADGLGKPRIMAVGPRGQVYISRREPGDILMLVDSDNDGKADIERRELRIPHAHGLAVRNDKLYIATIQEVLVADIQRDGSLSRPRVLIDDLPDGGQHPNRTLAFDADGFLYISVGSTCNACNEPNPEHATILRADPGGRTIFARGLRNTIGFAFHPETGELWGMDHGTDWLGDDECLEELNRIERGKHYGWPWVYNDRKINPATQDPPNGTTRQQVAERSEPPALTYTSHAAPMQLLFCTGDNFPDEYRGDAIVTMKGSWNRSKASGYEIVRIRFDDDGQPEKIEPFIGGFLTQDGKQQFGRPCGLAQLPDGSLLVGDDDNGVIYRVSYQRTTADKGE